MTFDSPSFWLLFPIAWAAWRFLPFAFAKLVLLVLSLGFYAWWDVRFLPLIGASAVLDFWIGGRLVRTEGEAARKRLVSLSLLFNLGLLAAFKYTPLAVRTAQAATGVEPDPFTFADWIVPVGISFYTFQTLSYTLDIYRRRIEPARSFTDFFLYVAFFPQLVAGPIVRAAELLPQFAARRVPSWERIELGLYRIVQGLFLKICVADTVAPAVGRVFEAPDLGALSSLSVWNGVVLFGVQIFADFAGYSGIAIGLAMLFGLRFPENFRYPYIARGLSEFWTRWHITLSQWLRDYLYIPLGGNRGGTFFTSRNLMLTMLLGGLWHGAAWTFVVWGALHGIGLVGERTIRSLLGAGGRTGRPDGTRGLLGAALAMGTTYVFVHICWVFFRAADSTAALQVLDRMFVAPLRGEGGGKALEWRYLAAAAPVALMHMGQLSHEWFGLAKSATRRAVAFGVMAFFLLVVQRGERPDFIYFQF